MSSPSIQYVANIYQAQRRRPPGGGGGDTISGYIKSVIVIVKAQREN